MKNKNLFESFYHAFSGLRTAFKQEHNLKFHVLAAILVIAASFILSFDKQTKAILIVVVCMVITAELFNTAIETIIDLVCGKRYSKLAKIAKDVAAAAVLVASAGAIGVGVLLFLTE